jgi:PDZ domain-containing secreted protein
MDSGSDGKGTVVSYVTSNSPLAGKVFHGDELIDINGTDVHEMNTSGKLYCCIPIS